MIRILFICHGNICRSTMAEFVFEDMIRKEGLEDLFLVESASTSRDEIGNGPHRGTVEKLRREGVPMREHRAVQMVRDDYKKYDYIIGMDELNMRDMLRITGGDKQNKLSLLLDYSTHPRDIADPWYTGDFEVTYNDIVEGCKALLEYLLREQGRARISK